MKHISLVLFALFIFVTPAIAQEDNQDRIDFANDFAAAVKEHNNKEIFKHLDKIYRKEQTKFLGGNKTQLLNELFSGMDGDTFVSMSIDAITKIEIAEVMEEADGNFTYIFRIRDGEHDILASLLLKKNKKKWGFEGARG